MIEFKHAMTGRPAFVEAYAVQGIVDAMEQAPPKLLGGQPELMIVGTLILVAGAQIPVQGDASEVCAAIERARKTIVPLSSSKTN